MGALTENRKRRLAALDYRLPSGLVLDSFPPASKKPKYKLQSLTPMTPQTPPPPMTPPPQAATAPPPANSILGFPPAPPLLRPVHGPQRIIKAFGLGSSSSNRSRPPEPSSRSERDAEFSDLVSLYLLAKKAAPFTPWRPVRRMEASFDEEADDRSREGLGLNQYKWLVKSVHERQLEEPELRSAKPSFSASPPETFDLTTEAQKPEEEPSEFAVVDWINEDATPMVVESTPAREVKASKNKSPLYKELYEDSIKRHELKLRSLDLEVELFEKKLSSSRLFHKLPEEKPKEPKKDFHDAFLPLTEEEEDDISRALHGRKRSEILVTHEASNIEITREILLCLTSSAWLNDEVINLYLELLKERERREPQKFLKCHFFNTFFFKKLINGKSGYDFKAVRRWTTQRKLGYGLIECDKIFVPIHKEIHWCLAVIDIKENKFQYLDSLGGMDGMVLRVLARYLMDEVRDKNGREIDIQSWKQEAVDGLPLQGNGWDCGMFMLKYADFYSRGYDLCFNQDDMPYFRKRTVKEILRLKVE